MMGNGLRQALIVIAMLMLLASPASASRVRQMRLDELLDQSGMIFIGTVQKVDPNAGGGDEPRTVVEFSVEETIAGQPADSLRFWLPEGALGDGTVLAIAGAPKFFTGETYLVFVQNGGWNLTPVTNGHHSYFRRVEVAGRRLLVSDSGRGVEAITDGGILTGPRISESAVELENQRSGRAAVPAITLTEALIAKIAKALPDERQLVTNIRARARAAGIDHRTNDIRVTPAKSATRTEASAP